MAFSIPSTGLLLLNARQLVQLLEDDLAPTRRVRDPTARVLVEHVVSHVVQDLDTPDLRIHVESFRDLAG